MKINKLDLGSESKGIKCKNRMFAGQHITYFYRRFIKFLHFVLN
jgi:hypothetical protein